MNTLSVNPDISHLINIQGQASVEHSLKTLLASIRTYLEMDVAFISEFTDTHRIFRHVDSKSKKPIIKVGDGDPLEESCCKKVVDGELPEIIYDAVKHPEACKMEVIHKLPVGAHISVPITLENGNVYGTFCCFSHHPNWSLNERDLNMMRVFANIAAKQIETDILKSKEKEEEYQRIEYVLNSDALSIVYQPIYDLTTLKIVGFESLSRFNTSPIRSPDIWFNEAHRVGLGVGLEVKAVQQALNALTILPNHVYISVNVSPETLKSGALDTLLENIPSERVILEVTEHAYVNHYDELAKSIDHLRKKGLWLAVDDAGAGYASFRHILSLSPEMIKLDISLTRDIHTDSARRALTSAFVGFAEQTNSKIVAEGVETEQELKTLKSLGVKFGQGYFLGKPMAIQDAMLIL